MYCTRWDISYTFHTQLAPEHIVTGRRYLEESQTREELIIDTLTWIQPAPSRTVWMCSALLPNKQHRDGVNCPRNIAEARHHKHSIFWFLTLYSLPTVTNVIYHHYGFGRQRSWQHAIQTSIYGLGDTSHFVTMSICTVNHRLSCIEGSML